MRGEFKMIRCFFKIAAFCLAFIFLCPVIFINAKECYWYVKRNKEHKQPVCDTDLSFIEQYGGIYVDKRYGDDNDEKIIYLTFDAGYENGNIAKIMDELKKEGIRGSFFILGNLIERNPELVRRMAEEGHSVCNHTFTHKNLTGASIDEFKNEIQMLENKYRELTGREMSKFYRPPEGTFNAEMLKRAQELGYMTVFWSFAYADWDNAKQMAESVALKKVLDNIHNGEIMLLHPTSSTNVQIIGELIKELKDQGYRFATLDDIR